MRSFASRRTGEWPQRARAGRRGRSLALELLETRTLLDAASLDPHGMFPGEMFQLGDYPDDMVVADFNADGIPDVAATNRSTNEIAVLFGRGGGILADPVRHPVGGQPYCVAAGDLNGDGHVDIVTGNFASITVLFGQGDGTFTDQRQELPGMHILDVEIVDIDEDGGLDIVAADYEEGRLLVFPGRGDGTFGDGYEIRVGEGARAVAVGDLNADGHLDLVTANSLDNSVSVLLGQGDGNFQPEIRYDVGQYPYSLELADLDHDVWTDLVVANYHDKRISVFFGAADGRFLDDVRYATGWYPSCPLAYDLDGDGRLDLLVPNFSANNMTVLLNRNDRSFADGGLFPTGNAPHKVILEDMNSDGREDLAVLAWGADAVAIHLAGRDGFFQAPAYHATELEPQNVVLADFNRDGHLDAAGVILSTDQQRFALSVHLGMGDGTFGDEIRTELPQMGESPVVGDVNEDGYLDIVLTSGNAVSRTILLGHGDGTFSAIPQMLTEQCRQQVLEDVDRDGHLDLICGTWDTADGKVSVSVYRGDGRGNFNWASTLPIARDLTHGRPLGPLGVEDIDRDGHLDVVVLGGAGVLLVLFGKEGAAFHAPQIYYGVPGVASGVADFNEDGFPDCFVTTTDALLILLNQGDGTFAAPVSTPGDAWVAHSLAGDLDRDGHADILDVLHGGHVRIRLGAGDGTLAPPVEYATGSFPGVPAIGDLNEDGWSDLVFADLWSGDLALTLQIPRPGVRPHGINLGGTSRLLTGEDGSTASFRIMLDNQPSRIVTIGLTSSDTTEGTVSPASLTFTPENWSTPQVVTVTGIDDDWVDGPVAFSILVDPGSSDEPVYAAMVPLSVQVVNLDDELTVEALGGVDFRRLEGVDLSGGVRGYSFETVREGLLTVEIAGTEGDVVELALFDAGWVETPLVRNGSAVGRARVEWTVREGRQYVVLASGSGDAADLCIANLLHRDGSQVTLYGTDRDDDYTFSAAGSYEVIVNGLTYSFDPAEVDKFLIHGADGTDRLEMFDSPADDVLRRASWFTSLTGPGYSVEATGFETTIAHADFGGLDVAQVDDTLGIDGFTGTPTWSELTGPGYLFRVESFEAVHAYLRPSGSRNAVLRGGDGNDKWKSHGNVTLLRAADFSYLVRTKFYERVSVDAGPGGIDTAIFYDSPDDETFHFDGADLTARIWGGGRSEHVATGFGRVVVYGGAGRDTAYLSDLPGEQTDYFYLKRHKAQLVSQGISVVVRAFDTVHIQADQGGFDVVRIYDTPGDDHLEVAGNTARLYRRYAGALDLLYESIAAERVKAYRSGGNDTQDIQEHTLDLWLYDWEEA